MSSFIVEGGHRLSGTIRPQGAKNEALQVISAVLLTKEEAEAVDSVRKATNSLKPEESVEKVLDLFARTKTNREFVDMAKKMKFF